MKLRIKLSAETVRTLCIKNNYYTNGSNEEYDNMVAMIPDNNEVDIEIISNIAKNIYIYSISQANAEDIANQLLAVASMCITYI